MTLLQAHGFLKHGDLKSTFQASSFFIGPFYETDLKNDIDVLGGEFAWEPIIKLGSLVTSQWRPLGRQRRLRYSITPRLGIELRDIRRAPASAGLEDHNFAKVSFQAGVSLLENRVLLTNDFVYRHGIGSSQTNPTFHRWQLSVPLDKAGRYSLTTNYNHGADAPSFDERRDYTIGLGIKY